MFVCLTDIMVRNRKISNIDDILSDIDADYEGERVEKKKVYPTTQEETVPIREPVGVVEYFYGKINVAAIKLSEALNVGDTIEIVEDSRIITHKITNMQIDKEDVNSASNNESIGIKIGIKVAKGSKVYKL